MSSIPFTDDYIKKSCKAYRKSEQGGATKRNFHVLKDGAGEETDYAVKMAYFYGIPGLRHEQGFMLHLSMYVDPKKVVIPKGYKFLQDGDWGLLVMQNIPGQTMWELMDDGNEELSPNDASDIANAIQELRDVVRPPSGEALTPSTTPWNIMGHVFKPDNEGRRALQTKEEFEDFMGDRLTKATGTTSRLPGTDYVFTHGDLSPHNIKRLPDGRLAIFDFDMSFFAPTYWEPYALYAAGEDPNYSGPLIRAFEARGLTTDPAVKGQLDDVRLWSFTNGIGTYFEEMEAMAEANRQGLVHPVY